MKPQIITLIKNIPTGPMKAYSTEAEAVQHAERTGQPFVWKLARQDTWLVAL